MRPNVDPNRAANQSLPSDLSGWASKRALVQLTLDAVQTIELHGMTPAKNAEFRPQMMLTLLTYCYSCGIYGSSDVEWAIEHDCMARYICARSFPDWLTIRRFRRQNCQALRQCLTYVFKQAWALKLDRAEVDYGGYDWIESVLLERIEASVQSRLETAAIMDRLAFDL